MLQENFYVHATKSSQRDAWWSAGFRWKTFILINLLTDKYVSNALSYSGLEGTGCTFPVLTIPQDILTALLKTSLTSVQRDFHHILFLQHSRQCSLLTKLPLLFTRVCSDPEENMQGKGKKSGQSRTQEINSAWKLIAVNLAKGQIKVHNTGLQAKLDGPLQSVGDAGASAEELYLLILCSLGGGNQAFTQTPCRWEGKKGMPLVWKWRAEAQLWQPLKYRVGLNGHVHEDPCMLWMKTRNCLILDEGYRILLKFRVNESQCLERTPRPLHAQCLLKVLVERGRNTWATFTVDFLRGNTGKAERIQGQWC